MAAPSRRDSEADETHEQHARQRGQSHEKSGTTETAPSGWDERVEQVELGEADLGKVRWANPETPNNASRLSQQRRKPRQPDESNHRHGRDVRPGDPHPATRKPEYVQGMTGQDEERD